MKLAVEWIVLLTFNCTMHYYERSIRCCINYYKLNRISQFMLKRPIYNPDSFYHWCEMDIRFRDLDPLNHVNNAVFNTYLEEARVQFVQSVPDFRESMQEGKSFVLVHIELDYLKPIHYSDSLLIGSALVDLGNSSIKSFQAIYSKETHELKAVAETTGVWFDLASQRPSRLPAIKITEKYFFKEFNNG
ncbi:MAG: thioesterase family protein [Balneolaceae bacterium]